ncbi:MAG: helix-turn-helix domain-containing protein [Bdellovibrionota bacterium]
MKKPLKNSPQENAPILSRESFRKTRAKDWLRIGQIWSEKCELKEAQAAFEHCFRKAKREGDNRSAMDAVANLLRLSVERLDQAAVLRWDAEVEKLMKMSPNHVPLSVWLCKGQAEFYRGNFLQAQRFFHRCIRQAKSKPSIKNLKSVDAEFFAKAWFAVANVLHYRGCEKRARLLAQILLSRFEKRSFRGINGFLYLLLGNIDEKEGDLKAAREWYQKSYSAFLTEHNWYYHLYVLYAFARLARHERNLPQALWYLDLIDRATQAPEFGILRREVEREKARLADDAVDLLIDSKTGVVKTRETGSVSLRKQYVLLHLLEALSKAHVSRNSDQEERGLSKADIIDSVWHESYRPEAHDNKLYYNINRLRKLIEPDFRKPKYLLNWKEGYRLAPGLKIQWIRDSVSNTKEGVSEK